MVKANGEPHEAIEVGQRASTAYPDRAPVREISASNADTRLAAAIH